MALVAYDCSDASDNEEDEEPIETVIVVRETKKTNDRKPVDISQIELSDDEDDIAPAPKSFLPAPTNSLPENNNTVDQNDGRSSLSLKLPPPINRNTKFTDLSLKSPFLKPISSQAKKYDEEDVIKKINTSKDRRGELFSLLPMPKNESVVNSSSVQKKSTPLLPYSFLKAKPMGAKKAEKKTGNDDDEETDLGSDFFSLNKNDTEDLPEPIDIDIDISLPSASKSEQNTAPSDMDTSEDYSVPTKPEHFNITYQDSASQNPLNLDAETMQRFFGRKRKGESLDNVQVIDINQDDVLAESKRLVTKQLTEEQCGPARKAGGFSSLSRRKHQITYLAFQAKEREVELKNMWAQNRLTKKQTQMKYGF